MAIWKPRCGQISDGLPFVHFGRGKETLIVLPGLVDAIQPVTSMPRYNAWTFRRFARSYSVFIISRKRGLPPGYGTKDMAADYGAAIEQIGKPAHILGISLGSVIAQHLAADFPDHVRGLILSFAGSQNAPQTISSMGRLIEFARRNNWRAVYTLTVETTFSGFRPSIWRRLVPPSVRRPDHPSDYIVSAEAYLAHDSWNRLPAITAPTLVLGGTEDLFVPEALYQDLADRIPGASLELIEGMGYDLYGTRRREFESKIVHFLKGLTFRPSENLPQKVRGSSLGQIRMETCEKGRN